MTLIPSTPTLHCLGPDVNDADGCNGDQNDDGDGPKGLVSTCALLRPEEALDGSMDPGPPYGAAPCDPHMDPSLLDLRNYGGPMAGPHSMGPPEPPMGPLDLGPGPPDHQGQHGSPKYICL